MPDNPRESNPGAQSLADEIQWLRRERGAAAEQRKEIGLLVKQTVAEIDRLAQVNRDVPSKMRQMEANLESIPRVEILRHCSSLHEGQMRQFMMQSQLEQLRNRQASLERVEGLLDRFLGVATHLASLMVEAAAGTSDRSVDRPELARAALQSAELARQRVSRHLQDVTTQVLSDLILRSEICERMMAIDQQQAREEMARLRKAASTALIATRQLVLDVHPPALEELGLADALRRYVESARLNDNLQIGLEVAGEERRLPPGTELAVFRIVQEALANAARHSGAARAEVRVLFEPGQLIATVVDEGQGFDPRRSMAQAELRSQSGLVDMRTRAGLVGATLEISSRPGGGCMVSVVVPC